MRHPCSSRRAARAGLLAASLSLAAALLPAAALLTGCAGAAVAPENQASTTVSLQQITCSSCARSAERAVLQTPGVLHTKLDLRAAELTVRYDRSRTSPKQVMQAIEAAGYQVALGAGAGSYKKHTTFATSMDVRTFKDPKPSLAVASLAVAGKVTVVDYFAEWCGPCRRVDREMHAQLLQHGDIKTGGLALRRLDIGDWESAFAQRHLAKVSKLPYVMVFGPGGEVLTRIQGVNLSALRAAIAKGLAARKP